MRLREAAAVATPSTMGSLDSIAGQTIGRYIQTMGGPRMIESNLSDAGKQRALEANRADLSRRLLPIVRNQAETFFGGKAGAAAGIMGTLDMQTVSEVAAAADRGASRTELRTLLMNQVYMGLLGADQVDGLLDLF